MPLVSLMVMVKTAPSSADAPPTSMVYSNHLRSRDIAPSSQRGDISRDNKLVLRTAAHTGLVEYIAACGVPARQSQLSMQAPCETSVCPEASQIHAMRQGPHTLPCPGCVLLALV